MIPDKTNIIVGPPGTGKTYQLLKILEQELKTHEPNEIAYVSFTREGAYQGRDRALEKFNYSEDDFPYFRKLHSIAFRELNMKPSRIIKHDHFKIFGKALNMNIKGYYDYNLAENDDMYLFYINLYRNNKKCARQIVDKINTQTLLWVEKNYEELKNYYGVMDFTDLIIEFNKRNKTLPVKVAIIDEAQDLTTLQWQMINIAFRDCEKIYIAGDDDQAIYEWSGADVEYFINLKGNIKLLDKSYRLPRDILNLAKNISSKIKNRIVKDFDPSEHEGNVYPINDLYEIIIKPGETYLFLSRNNMFLNDFKTLLIRRGVNFAYQNKSFVNKEHVTAINTYVRLQKGQKCDTQARNLLNKYTHLHTDMSRMKEIEWYNALKIPQEKMIYYRDLLKNKIDVTKCLINVNTIHSVKGAEADNVILYLNVTRSVYKNIQMNPDSEHRVFYVGATRAKKNLYILLPTKEYYYNIL